MPTWKCEVCGNEFVRCRSGDRPIRFCCQKCYHQWRKDNGIVTGFKKGVIAWNKGTKGVMKENSGSFKKGRESEDRRRIGTMVIRKGKSGNERVWVKVADNRNSYDWELRAVVRWRKVHGPIPEGMIIHHKDRNTLNDDITNLELLTRAEHMLEHKVEVMIKGQLAAAEATRRRHARNRYLKNQAKPPE